MNLLFFSFLSMLITLESDNFYVDKNGILLDKNVKCNYQDFSIISDKANIKENNIDLSKDVIISKSDEIKINTEKASFDKTKNNIDIYSPKCFFVNQSEEKNNDEYLTCDKATINILNKSIYNIFMGGSVFLKNKIFSLKSTESIYKDSKVYFLKPSSIKFNNGFVISCSKIFIDPYISQATIEGKILGILDDIKIISENLNIKNENSFLISSKERSFLESSKIFLISPKGMDISKNIIELYSSEKEKIFYKDDNINIFTTNCKAILNNNKIESIICEGDVNISSIDGKKGVADNAFIDLNLNKVTLTSNSKNKVIFSYGDNYLSANVIECYLSKKGKYMYTHVKGKAKIKLSEKEIKKLSMVKDYE